MSQLIRRHKSNKDAGFTLIEMLIVVVVLGILSGIAVFAVQSLTGTSVQAACKSDYKTVEVAVEAYKAQLGIYPTQGQDGISGTATDAVMSGNPPVNTANGLLIGYTPAGSPKLGPWLRDQPINGQHYRIEVPLSGGLSGTGTVQVWKYDGSAQIPSSGAQSTAADCSSLTS